MTAPTRLNIASPNGIVKPRPTVTISWTRALTNAAGSGCGPVFESIFVPFVLNDAIGSTIDPDSRGQ